MAKKERNGSGSTGETLTMRAYCRRKISVDRRGIQQLSPEEAREPLTGSPVGVELSAIGNLMFGERLHNVNVAGSQIIIQRHENCGKFQKSC